MKVPHVHGPDDLRLVDIETPTAGPHDVVLKVLMVGVCGSDLGMVARGPLRGNPVPLGHELSGVVIEAGQEVSSVRTGDRVILNPLINMIGNGGPEGGFAERLLVRDVTGHPEQLLKLPANVTSELGALVEPLAVGAHAINRLGAKRGDKVAVFGAGPIGLAAIVALRHRGVEEIVVFEPSEFRRERALELGAKSAFDPLTVSAFERLKELHGAVATMFGEAPQTTHYLEASGAPLIPDIVANARTGAVICVSSLQKKPVALDFTQMMVRELTVTSVMGYPTELPDVLAMLAGGDIDLGPMVSHRYPGSEVIQAFEAAKDASRAAKVLVQYEPSEA